MPNRREFLKLAGVAGGAGLLAGSAAADPEGSQLTERDLPAEGDRPTIRVVGTGGTIASSQEAAEDGGYSLANQAEAIVAAVPELEYFVNVDFVQVAQKGSSSLLVEDYVAVAKEAMRAEADGVDGVIVTHGTDAIEEDAFFNDLVLDLDIPVAFVGAMRPSDATSADGPANLLTAVRMLTRTEFHLDDEPCGVYVVLNDTIHAARDVTKTWTTKVETFESGPAGPIGYFTDNELVLYREPGSYSANLSHCDLDAVPDMTVPIVTHGAGAESYTLEQAVAGDYHVDGAVVLATGFGGGVSPAITEATEAALEAGIPVARSTRVHWAPLNPGYDDDRTGDIVVMEDLPAWKARLHVMVALTMTGSYPGLSSDLEVVRKTMEDNKYGIAVPAPSTLG